MTSRIEAKLSRRHVLRGAGSVAIGLPFLLGREGSLKAQANVEAPERLITVYFGNGLPPTLTQNGYSGVLAPLSSFADKLTMIRGISTHAQAEGPGHDAGSHAYCCAFDSSDNANKQGPSLDWVAKEALAANTPFQTVSAGVFSGKQGGKRNRWIHSWRGAKQPNEPFTNPLKLFQSLFGDGGNMMNPDATDVALAAQRHRERTSILDVVRTEYQALVGPTSGYPASSKAIISDHLELLREVEKRVLALNAEGQAEACTLPTAPAGAEGTQGDLSGYMAHWSKIWPVMTDIYVAGLRCDLFRFGNVLVTNGGDEFSHQVGNDSAEDIHGDWFHLYGDHKQGVETIIQWELQLIADFLGKLNDPGFLDPNGKTILDNATTFIGTELGALPHGHEDLTFFMAGAKGRFKGGVQQLSGRSDVDMYQAILQSLNVTTKFGDQKFATGPAPLLV